MSDEKVWEKQALEHLLLENLKEQRRGRRVEEDAAEGVARAVHAHRPLLLPLPHDHHVLGSARPREHVLAVR